MSKASQNANSFSFSNKSNNFLENASNSYSLKQGPSISSKHSFIEAPIEHKISVFHSYNMALYITSKKYFVNLSAVSG